MKSTYSLFHGSCSPPPRLSRCHGPLRTIENGRVSVHPSIAATSTLHLRAGVSADYAVSEPCPLGPDPRAGLSAGYAVPEPRALGRSTCQRIRASLLGAGTLRHPRLGASIPTGAGVSVRGCRQARAHSRRAISRDLAAISCSFTVSSSPRRIRNLPPIIVLSTMPPDTPKST